MISLVQAKPLSRGVKRGCVSDRRARRPTQIDDQKRNSIVKNLYILRLVTNVHYNNI